jgi:hypothetical protein
MTAACVQAPDSAEKRFWYTTVLSGAIQERG